MATRGFMPYRNNSMNNFMKILQMYKMMQALGSNEPGVGGSSISELGPIQAGVSATGSTLQEEEERRKLRELLLGGF